jgi:hypothetical protein
MASQTIKGYTRAQRKALSRHVTLFEVCLVNRKIFLHLLLNIKRLQIRSDWESEPADTQENELAV